MISHILEGFDINDPNNFPDVLSKQYINTPSPSAGAGPGPSPSPSPGPGPGPGPSGPSGSFQYDSNPYDTNYLSGLEQKFDKMYGNGPLNTPANFDPSLNLVDPPAIYYQPGSFTYSGGGYVPSYEDLYMSSLTNTTQVGFVENAPYMSGGFCQTYADDIYGLEQKCNSLSNEICASTECCALLGGQKCVAGDAQGPKLQSNYSNFLVKNKDFYYYQGKCYGNCSQNNL